MEDEVLRVGQVYGGNDIVVVDVVVDVAIDVVVDFVFDVIVVVVVVVVHAVVVDNVFNTIGTENKKETLLILNLSQSTPSKQGPQNPRNGYRILLNLGMNDFIKR